MNDDWDLSSPDWFGRLQRGESLIPRLPLFEAEANRGVAVFDRLRLADVPGTPRLGPVLPGDAEEQEGDAAGEWFRDLVRALFGSWNRAQRRRFIREIFCLVPKKNSKTSYGALLMLTALLLNERPRAPFILTAPVQDTAELAFNQVAGAIALDPVLDKKLHVRDHLKTVVHRETKAELEIITFDPAVVTGKKPVGTMIDEVHVLGKMVKAASALRQLRGGMLPFPEAFLFQITTQSEEPPAGVFAAELEKARDVRDGKLRAPILPVLYELPEKMQRAESKPWKEAKHWHLVTPNRGRSITVERLKEEGAIAERTSEAEFRAWASQHLNVQIGMAMKAGSWSGADHWEAAADATVDLEHILEACEVITIGIDGGGLDDLLGLTVTGRESKEHKKDALGQPVHRWLTWSHAWAHPSVKERRKEIATQLDDHAAQGDLTWVEEIGDDVAAVAEIASRVHAAGLLAEKGIGVDPHAIGAIVDALVAAGIEETDIVGISQGWYLVSAIKTAERRLAARTLVHGGRPLMAWCVSNAKVESRGNAVLITKAASGTGKIDPLMALLDSVDLMSRNPKPRKKATFQFFTVG